MAKSRLTLRLVVGALCATLVVIVAAVTLAITYTVSIGTVRDIGRNYARALAMTATVQTQNFFNAPVQHCNTLGRYFLHDNYDIPTADTTLGPISAHDKYFDMHFGLHSNSNFTYGNTGLAFEDGSGSAMNYVSDTVLALISRFVMGYPTTNMQLATYAINVTTGTQITPSLKVAFGVAAVLVNYDARVPVYVVARTLASTNKLGMWYPVSLFAPRGVPFYLLPLAMPLYNKTNHFIGMATIGQPIVQIKDFLRTAQSTASTQLFAIDSQGYILAGTPSTPTYTVTQVNSSGGNLPTGCSTSADGNTGTDPYTFVACRSAASAFTAYAPLAELGSSNPDFLIGTGMNLLVTSLAGDNFFVVSSNVANSFRFFKMNILVFLPESDIVGDIVTGRNTAIGITVGVCIVAAAASFMLVFVLLQPLHAVSKKMLDTAKLRDTDNEAAFSNLAEIQDLQKAYSNMNTAIKSFTRYVPRDVVKDLMLSGQLCTINMTPQRCTMLFVDIASFTTICERVPADVLSGLVSQYFDRASRIVMDHDGLIDKFIGDCIMAVWGAPFPTPNQEVKATITGKLIDRETIVEPLAAQWDEAGEQLRVRVGVSTGVVLAGNMGSEDRMSYTVIGDPVNLAARLESMNKQFGTRVMVSEMTAESLGNIFVLRLLLPIAVVGKEEPVKVYEVMGVNHHLDASDNDRLHAGEQMEPEKITRKTTDSFSISESAASTLSSQQAGMRRGNRNTIQMLRDAQMKTAQDCPITCTDEEVTFANRHTDAVLAYMRKDFRGALNMFMNIHKNTPAHLLASDVPIPHGQPTRTNTAGKSVSIVEKLCEEYAVHCPEDFDGVFRALEK